MKVHSSRLLILPIILLAATLTSCGSQNNGSDASPVQSQTSVKPTPTAPVFTCGTLPEAKLTNIDARVIDHDPLGNKGACGNVLVSVINAFTVQDCQALAEFKSIGDIKNLDNVVRGYNYLTRVYFDDCSLAKKVYSDSIYLMRIRVEGTEQSKNAFGNSTTNTVLRAYSVTEIARTVNNSWEFSNH